MIPYLLAAIGGYFIGKSMQTETEKFADGGSVADKYQIKKGDKYFYLSMDNYSPRWAASPDMGYLYDKDEAEGVKKHLEEKEGISGLSIVKYDKDWWKNAPEEFAEGGEVNKFQYQITKVDNGQTYFYRIKMDTNAELPFVDDWNLVYGATFTKKQAKKLKTMLEKNGEKVKIIKSKFSDGGTIKWQDVEVGDSAIVKDINKAGVIVKTYGRKFHLKFVDGTEKTYDATELEFFKD